MPVSDTPQREITRNELSIEMTKIPPFQIQPIIPYALHCTDIAKHVQAMQEVLSRCTPPPSLLVSPKHRQEFLHDLPRIHWDKPDNAPGALGFYLLTLSPKREGIEHKIDVILREWSVPHSTSTILSSRSLYFYWDLFPEQIFLLIHAEILLENSKDLHKALSHLPNLTIHITSAIKNPIALRDFFAQSPLLQDLKQTQIHKELVTLIEKLPHLFSSSELFEEMGRVFALCPRTFFSPRPVRSITKIIAFHFLMRAHMRKLLSLHPETRHLEVRCIRTELQFPFSSRFALGLVLAVAPLEEHECFEEGHISQAIQTVLPYTRLVQGSFYSYQNPQDTISTLYVEIEKREGEPFTSTEMSKLKAELAHELKRRIEKLVPTVFMARNEEETIRNILLLSQELQRMSDIPQAMISLDSQTSSDLFFTIILVRLLRPRSTPLNKSFDPFKSEAAFLTDRIQQVGFLRKTTPKEAHVFRLRLPKDPSLLRADYSVNFYLARNKVSSLLTKAIGPFRDYNGGMIIKQGELFDQLQNSFPDIASSNPEQLENFFFSLNPIETQATLPLTSVQLLFSQFLEAQKADLPQKESYFLKIDEKKRQFFITIRTQGSSFKEYIEQALEQHSLLGKSLVHSFLHTQGSLYTSLILPHIDEKKQHPVIRIVHDTLRDWKHRIQNAQIVKLSFPWLPRSFDPRFSGDEDFYVITKLLFEGLYRRNAQGQLEPAAAKSVKISSDRLSYLFKLKRSYWSDGSPVTAQDFAYAWKKILSPTFHTPFSYLFYSIKNAKKAKENQCTPEEIGVTALDDFSLLVELEHPTEEFLELTTLPTYSPVHHVIDKIQPNWGSGKPTDFLCNGPFVIENISSPVQYVFKKNSFYWDKDHVRLEGVVISQDDILSAMTKFEKGEVHWISRHMKPWTFLEKNPSIEQTSVTSGICWCSFNTQKFPFHSLLLRQALDLALDREELVSLVCPNFLPAATPLPLSYTLNYDPNNLKGNTAKALVYFEAALKELGLTRQTFPLLTLYCADYPLRVATASYMVARWKALFHIPCRFEALSFSALFSKGVKGDFQTALFYWKSQIDSPRYVLNVFEEVNFPINISRWSHPEYARLLDVERQEKDPVKKISYLAQAEKILCDEKPVIALFYENMKNVIHPHLHKTFCLRTSGQVDFKYAHIERKESYVHVSMDKP